MANLTLDINAYTSRYDQLLAAARDNMKHNGIERILAFASRLEELQRSIPKSDPFMTAVVDLSVVGLMVASKSAFYDNPVKES